MTDQTKKILKLAGIALIALAFLFLFLFGLSKFQSCNKPDTTYTELSPEYLKLDSSNKAKDKEIERLITVIKDSIKNTIVQQEVIKYIKVYLDSNIVRQSANDDYKQIKSRFKMFSLNNPALCKYAYDSSEQKHMNLAFNEYDFLKQDNKILNKRCEFLTIESGLWESRFEVSQKNYDNCQNELQRILDIPKITSDGPSDFKFKLAGYLHYQNEFKKIKDYTKARIYISGETGIQYKKLSLLLHYDTQNLDKFEIKTGFGN